MNDILDIDLILKKQKYSKVYNIGLILIIIILISLYIIFTYKYQTYYISKAKVIDNKLELIVNIDDIKYIKENTAIEIDEHYYTYTIDSISDELYINEFYNNYKYIYINVVNLSNLIDNYVYDIKIPKENKIIAKYLKNYL